MSELPQNSQEYINQEFRNALDGKKLVLATGTILIDGKEDTRDYLCISDMSGKMLPVSPTRDISVAIVGTSEEHYVTVEPDEIKWEDEHKPIKLREAVEKGHLSKNVEIGLNLVVGTGMRLDGKSEAEIIHKSIQIGKAIASFKVNPQV